MAKKKAAAPEPAGESAPMWIVSFADLVTLMMSFFVVLYALKQGGPQQQLETAAAIKAQFGYQPPEDSTDPLDLAVMGILDRRRPPMDRHKGTAETALKGATGRHDNVETIREGQAIVEGGAITFAAGSAQIEPGGDATIRKLADILKGKTNVLMVKGHVSSDEVALRPDDVNGLSLSYRRAVIVAEALTKYGLDQRVLRPVACGPFEPLKLQIYDEAALRQNRRVEVFSTDTTASDFFPATLVPPASRASETMPDQDSPATRPAAPHSATAAETSPAELPAKPAPSRP